MNKIANSVIRQSLTCLPAFLTAFVFGAGWGWITSPSLEYWKSLDELFNDFVFIVTPGPACWLGAICAGRIIFGSFVSPVLVDNIGRKSTLFVVSLLLATIWIMVIVSRNFYVVLSSHFLFGLGNAMNDLASSIYITENCTPRFRGISGSAVLVFSFVGHIFGTNLSFTNVAVASIVIAMAAVGSTYCGVETTYYLAMKGRGTEARQSLVWSQPGRDNYDEEIEIIRKHVAEDEKEKKRSIKTMFVGTNTSEVILLSVICGTLQLAVALPVFMLFALSMFLLRMFFTARSNSDILLSILPLVASVLACSVIEVQSLFVLSFSQMFAGNIYVLLLQYLHQRHPATNSFSCLSITSFVTNTVIFTLALPAASIVASEILPLRVRAVGGNIAITLQWLTFLVAVIFLSPVTQSFNMEGNLMTYAIIYGVTFFFVYKILAETREKSLHNMRKKTADVVDLELTII